MVSFRAFRHALDLTRGHKALVDEHFLRLLADIKLVNLPAQIRPMEKKSLPTHFLSARQFLETIDVDWVQKYMRTVPDLSRDIEKGLGESQGGIYILRDDAVDFFRHNGRLP